MTDTGDLGPPPDALPCGRSVDDVLDQVADGRGTERDAHQAQCPHCQAALSEYERIWAPVRELGDERVQAPDSILETALAQIRRAIEHPDYGVITSPDGLTRVSARVVVVAARQGAQQVPGVRVALSKHLAGVTGEPGAPLDGDPPTDVAEDVAAGVSGSSAAVQITLAADYGTDLVRLGELVRSSVTTSVRDVTSLEPAQVTVIIDDVLP
ncbi:cell envelope-related Asp23 family protein [Pseudonocardia sediminis]|uniref:Cell envelope-related Asp23 family protein n=1 Tax=Pseudonocardia sediminis TaxID=1397368 RepID=A0A4Q7V350_PSEST|nr:Asp23/Gls24 family envelope stress response protein [Pseudonocardia sediminis]RZT89012.1 cell envelope-related Asp23 family protein [Pseudonocardia sediminis]